ncbi:MAG TPA: DUF2336 domain-containing protein [Stellaceae bacterium]|jgi:uncharacterized protein (DUF2336 family)|nr:DUF2336 domain-containing protein [Stellaceae bacterium]
MLTMTLPQSAPDTAATGLDNPSWIRRAMLLEQIAEAYADGTFTPVQRRQAEDLFRTAIYDHEALARSVLAESLKRMTHVPHDIVLSLARDEAQVARPILRTSPLLDEDDLLEIAREGSRAHRLAIAERDALSSEVAQALCESRDLQVICSLLANEGAALPEALLHAILNRFGDAAGTVEAMMRRRLLPVSVANRLARENARSYATARRA